MGATHRLLPKLVVLHGNVDEEQINLRSLSTEALWALYAQDQSDQVRDELAARCAGVVQQLAASLVESTGLDERELVRHGLAALISAIERFDADAGADFETYATDRIRRGMIDEYIALAIGPDDLAEQAGAITEAFGSMERELGRAPTDAEVSHALGYPLLAYRQLLQRIFNSTVRELELIWALPAADSAVIARSNAASSFEGVEELVHQATELKDDLASAIGSLPDREKLVIALFYYENLTLREVGEVLGLSEARVGELRTKAMLRLKSRLADSSQTGTAKSRPRTRGRRRPGRLRGQILLAPDFDQTPPDLLDAFEGS